mgnify:CR=1 FL=1
MTVINDPTREMIAAGAWKLRDLKNLSPPDNVLVEAVWFAMNEARTQWERIGNENISTPDA